MEDMDLQTYFRGQQVAMQWHPFLLAMAAEMAEQSDDTVLRNLFAGIGRRFAADAEEFFSDVATLSELQECLNDFWGRMQWGWVRMHEESGFVEIVHNAAPLAEAFGDEFLVWSVGFLEGFYQSVFGALGASESMGVRAHEDQEDGMALRLRFGK
ncbi:MAG: hypothetical protein RLZ68_2455 [Pseudomonadota bacterium]|jgi:Cellulose synthase subunit D